MEGRIVTQARPPSIAAAEPGEPPASRSWRSSPFAVASAACAALAALSAAVLPTVPSYDPWSWIVWGREVSDPHLSFLVNGGPSWKPLPVIFTTIYGLFGGAAPTLWVITARFGGLMAFVAAFRLAALLVRRLGYGRAAPAAGVIAAASLILTQDWASYWYRGASEPLLVGTALWAVDRLIAGRRWQAFVIGIALGLMRPEVWPFMIAYGAWLLYEERTAGVALAVLAGLVSMPLLWFVPPGISTGQPFLAASHAHEYNGHLGAHPVLEVLRRGVDDQSVPVLVLALIAVGITLYKERDRLVLYLCAGAAAWWAVVVAMTAAGYPGLERFFLPAAAIACVLAGVGIVRIGALAGEAVGALRRGSVARFAAVAGAVAAVVVCYPFVSGRVDYARAQESVASKAVSRLNQLSAAVAAVGGHRAVYPCRTSFAAVNHSVQTALAWKLHVTLERVGTSMRHQGLLFVGPWDSIDGAPPPINHRLTQRQLIAHVGVWRVYRMTAPGASTRCVGS